MSLSPATRVAELRRRFVLSTADTALAVGAIGVHVLVAIAMQFLPGFTWRDRHTVQLTAQLFTGAFLTYAAWRASRDTGLDRRTRQAWQYLTAAASAQWIGYAIFWYVEYETGTMPSLSISDAVYLLYYPLLFIGLLKFPWVSGTRDESVKYSLDVATVVVAGVVALVHFALPPDLFAAATDIREMIYIVIYPLGDVVVLVGVTMVWLRQPSGRRSRVVRAIAAGLAVSLAADAVYAYRVGHGTYEMGSPLDIMWAASSLLVALGAHLQRSESRRLEAIGRATVASLHPSSLPYLGSALVYGLLLIVSMGGGTATLLVLSVGATLVTALVLARQWVAVRENLRLTSEGAARESEARFRALVQHASEMLLIVDADFAVRYASPAALKALTGRETGGGLVGERLLQLVHPEDIADAVRLLGHAVARGRESVRGEWRFRAPDGRVVLAEHVATNLLDEPTVEGIVLNSRDVSERAELERQLTHQAFHDPLTQLANRTLFRDRLEHALKRNGRTPGGVALLFLDLDDFKRVNDSLGHAVGDTLLVQVSARIARELREGDTLARFGGDEFAILLEDVVGPGMAMTIADRVLAALREPFAVEGKEICVGVSIGIAGSHEAQDSSDLMRNADLAMYIAKTRGKGGCAVFEPHMHADVVVRLDIEADLRHAVDAQELTLVFQPVVGLAQRHLIGVEALLRWSHPTRGEIPPSTFIPIAEDAGLVVPIGRWVLREACRQARQWLDETGMAVHVGVNVSARQIHDPSLLEDVRSALADAGLPPSQLLLEITESVLMRDSVDVERVLHGLRALGVTLALDDFGTGYSSLSYLQRFPIDVLKIDKSFVAPMAARTFDPRLVRAIIALGESLGMRIVAEGVETDGQLEALRALGCEMGQGYLFARPLSSKQLVAHLRDELVLSPRGDATHPPAALLASTR